MPIQELLGTIVKSIEGAQQNSEEIVFTLDDGRVFRMRHKQDCCELVRVSDVCGDIADLVGSPIVRAEAPSSKDEPKPEGEFVKSSTDFFTWTWTFYILGTARGSVTIRWLGESTGSYAEGVDAEWA